MTEREFYLRTREREHATTLRVMHAYPKDRKDFAPHERSQTAQRLFWTYVLEEKINAHILAGDLLSVSIAKEEDMPEDIDTIMQRYQEVFDTTTALLASYDDRALEDVTEFWTGAQRKIDLLWMMLLDSIHHRGQLSVYVRMAGGKVPSIYGPSADEPMIPKS